MRVTSSNIPIPQVSIHPTASRAARAQDNGFSALERLSRSLSSASLPSPSPTPSPSPLTLTSEECAAVAQCQLECDLLAVDLQLEKYGATGVISGAALADFDILRFWQVGLSTFFLF